jgi:hypothetical protein
MITLHFLKDKIAFPSWCQSQNFYKKFALRAKNRFFFGISIQNRSFTDKPLAMSERFASGDRREKGRSIMKWLKV